MFQGEKVAVYIRTYKNDIPFAEHCVRLISKYLIGYDELIVEIPDRQQHYLRSSVHFKSITKVVTTKAYVNDYIGQCIDKMQAYRHTNAKYIIFVDSDTMLTRTTDVSEFFFAGLPIIQYKHYADHVKGEPDFTAWKFPTQNALQVSMLTREYMCRFPFVFKSETLEACVNHIEGCHNSTLEDYAMSLRRPLSLTAPVFSEFNCLGAYADVFENNDYCFVYHTEMEDVFKNYWSWEKGGIKSFLNEINQL